MLFVFRPAGTALVLDHLVYGILGKVPMNNGQADWCGQRGWAPHLGQSFSRKLRLSWDLWLNSEVRTQKPGKRILSLQTRIPGPAKWVGVLPVGTTCLLWKALKVAADSWTRRGVVPECQVDRVYTSHHYKREHLHMAGTSRT